jgi:leucyl-tRNA synthetase
MGVQKDLEATKTDLAKVKTFIDKSNVPEAKKAVEAIEKKLNTIIAAFNKKMSQNMAGIQKLDTAVSGLLDILKKTPFDGPKAAGLITAATTAAAAAVTLTKSE